MPETREMSLCGASGHLGVSLSGLAGRRAVKASARRLCAFSEAVVKKEDSGEMRLSVLSLLRFPACCFLEERHSISTGIFY